MSSKALIRPKEQGYKKLSLAISAGKSGDYRQALEILEKLISGINAPPEAWLMLGRSYHALGDYSRAIAAFNDYLKLRPRSSQGYLFIGRTYLAVSMPQRAAPFLKKAHELHPGNVQITALLGMAYLKSRHSAEAVNIFQTAVETAANKIPEKEYKRIYRAYINALLVRGVRLCRNNDYDLGAQMLRFVLENGSPEADSPFLRLELGRASRETGRLEEALQHYSRALQFAPEDRRIRWSRASILMALERNTEAREDIEKIRAWEPGVPQLPWNSSLVDLYMIRSFMEAGEWRSAAELCRNYLKRQAGDSAGNSVIHALCAEALRNLRDFGAAHNHIVRAQEHEPLDLQYCYADILVCWEAKDWPNLKKAIRTAKNLGGDSDIIKRFSVLLDANTSTDDKKTLLLLQNAVRKLGPEPELMYALGLAYLKLGFPQEAINWFRKTIHFKDHHEEAWLGEIAALEALAAQGLPLSADSSGSIDSSGSGKPVSVSDELGKIYNEYLEHWPDNVAICRERALYLIKIFEYAQAAAELEKLLLAEPSNPSLRRVLAYAYRKTGRYREAAVFLKALLREKPDNLELLLEYTGCLERAGGIRYALTVLEKAKEIFGESPDLYLALGILHFRNKKTEAAFDSLREAASIDRTDPRPYEWMAVMARKGGDSGQAAYYEREARKRKNFTKINGKAVAKSGKKL